MEKLKVDLNIFYIEEIFREDMSKDLYFSETSIGIIRRIPKK